MSLKGKLRCVGQTDTGRVREHNEDTIAFDADIGLLVLADGMGGYNAGEVASGIAVKTIVDLVRDAVEREDLRDHRLQATGLTRAIDHPARCDPAGQQDHLSDRPHAAAVRGHGHDRGRRPVLRQPDRRLRMWAIRACIACAPTGFEQLTMDHSLLQELVDRGFYSPEEAQRAANKNYVTRALGVEPNVDVEVQEHPVQKGDLYLLCSDGLSDMVEDDDIHLTISTFGANLETAAKQLIQLGTTMAARTISRWSWRTWPRTSRANQGIFDKMLGWFS